MTHNIDRPDASEPEGQPQRKSRKWLRLSLIGNGVLVAGVLIAVAAMFVLNQSDTNPGFCAICHIMRPYVESYRSSNDLDNVHAQANVQCKECHSDYDIPDEIASGWNFVIGNYEDPLAKRRFENDICLQCHISEEYVANQTDFLFRNPHRSHFEDLPCRTCHVSHGDQIDYCSMCHDHGEQRLVGEEIVPRSDNPFN